MTSPEAEAAASAVASAETATDPEVPVVDVPSDGISEAKEGVDLTVPEGEAVAAAAPAVAVSDPEVPVVEIPPNENISSETLADKSIGEVAKDDMVMEDAPQEVAAAADGVTVETTTVTTTEVIEVVTTPVVAAEEVTMEVTTETSLGKREREETETENGDDDSKRLKADDNGKEEKDPVAPVKLGPKLFHSGIEMFTYFYDLLHGWVANVDINKYEHMVLSDLITKGHRDAESKVGSGIKAFQIRFHTGWHSRCYYLVRTDGSVEDFSYRKCVDRLMPLPESLFSPSGDLIVEKLFGSSDQDKWDKKGKGKGGADNGEREGKGYQGHKGRGGGGGWRGGKGGGGRGKRW
ncbi:hypothetical protein Mapa_004812 [Marchantia paleacea]|nr:hypothetical protein Mapa_004812 [Marchantia paleacea]